MLHETSPMIGARVNRVEGRDKVTGRGAYAADRSLPGMLHAYGVFSTIAAGRLLALDTRAAERSPGVKAVLHHRNFPRLKRSPNQFDTGTKVGEIRLPFEDETIYYAGQFIAVVLAETFEQARAAAQRVRAEYETSPPRLSLSTGLWPQESEPIAESPDLTRGDPAAAWKRAACQIDALFSTPVEVHNPMELHATVASWAHGHLLVHDSTQWVVGARKTLAKLLRVPLKNVTVRAPFVGGGFGGKLFLWGHTLIAAAAARQLGRPVKLVVPRRNQFTTVGHRPATRQRLRIGARADGTLVSLRHDTVMHTSLVDDFFEACGEASKSMYRCAHVGVTHRMVRLNVGTPTPMRSPGAAPGTFALECAIDEVASALKLDPIELRRRNEARRDENTGKPWSSKHLDECYRAAADRFGWSRRSPEPGTMRDGGEILGWGFAASTWPAFRQGASARVELRADGTAAVICGTQDPGTGTFTIAAQVAAEVTGLPVDRIRIEMGDSSFPEGPISGGSMVTSTVVPVIAEACRQALAQLRRLAAQKGPLAGAREKSLVWRNGRLHDARRGRDAGIAEILAGARRDRIRAETRLEPGAESKRYSFRSFGAHCVEVRWDPGLARLRVSRVVSAFDAGRIINHKAAENQILGSIVMGLGMTLLEAAVYDPHSGRVVNDNLADYALPVNADTPAMEAIFVEHPDPHIGEFGARGVGELGIAGLPAAIANAVYHATGRRFRDLPIRIEDLIS